MAETLKELLREREPSSVSKSSAKSFTESEQALGRLVARIAAEDLISTHIDDLFRDRVLFELIAKCNHDGRLKVSKTLRDLRIVLFDAAAAIEAMEDQP